MKHNYSYYQFNFVDGDKAGENMFEKTTTTTKHTHTPKKRLGIMFEMS
jgi:hypothetical protein